MSLRTSPDEIQSLLDSRAKARSGKVMYPVRTFDPHLLDSMARDLRDYQMLDARLDKAIKVSEERGMKDMSAVLRDLRK